MSKRVQTELMIVSDQGNLERLKALSTLRNLEDKNAAGFTALALAAKAGHLDVAKELITQGANINAINDVIFTSVGWAKHPFYSLLA